jgi:adenylate cyclase
MQREPYELCRLLGLVIAHHGLEHSAQSDAALEELIRDHAADSAYNIAYVLAYRSERDRAFEWLDKAVEQRDPGLQEIVLEPLFSKLHDDPRWLPFLASIGYAPQQLDAIEFEVRLPAQGS